MFAEKIFPVVENLYITTGVAYYNTDVKGFTEENSQYNVTVKDFELNDVEFYVDATYNLHSKFGATFISVGASSHQSLSATNIQWDGGLVSHFDYSKNVSRTTLGHAYGPFYAKATFSSVEMDTYEVGFQLQF